MMYFINNLNIRILLWGFFALVATRSQSQSTNTTHNVEITYNKTSSIVFPAVIKSVDRGSRDILAQKAQGVSNVLQIKAGRENFPETNLTVITVDGRLTNFKVTYSSQPASLTIDLSGSSPRPSLIFQNALTETDMENYSSNIIQSKKAIRFINEKEHKINLALLGIYIKDDVMFYRLRITNLSNIDYDVDFLKFYVKDKARIKRTASQEIEVNPIYVYGNDKSIEGSSYNDLVYALPKLTIPESKRLSVELFEKNGGRNFELEIKNKTIVNAHLLE